MKKVILTILLVFVFTSVIAQDRYFHELKGMEDSTGTTHLFYRLYEKNFLQCGEGNGGHIVSSVHNNLYHFDTEIESDSIKFGSGWSEWCIQGISDGSILDDYNFYLNDPSKWIIQVRDIGCGISEIRDYLERRFEIPSVCLLKTKSPIEQTFDQLHGFVLALKEDIIYLNQRFSQIGFPIHIKEDFFPKFNSDNGYEGFENYLDSRAIEYGVRQIHPSIDSLFYSKNDLGNLLISEEHATDFIIADSTISYFQLAFDSDSSYLYAIVTQYSEGILKRKLKISANFGRPNTWFEISVPEDLDLLQYLVTVPEKEGHLYITDSLSIYSSEDFGKSFSHIIDMPFRITGIYKKPDSDILFVLTSDEFFAVNEKTLVTRTLRKLPVSNEEESTEIPNSVVLHQNYPNPFNPNTTISFELDRPAEVRLVIFDVLGRTVSTLVNERKTADLHQVPFDASNLSSGIYFYQLETGNFSLTKKLTLIK